MSKDIYTIQEKLDSILDIYTCYETPDKKLFDCSDYVNDGKGSGHFDRTGMSPWNKGLTDCYTLETLKSMSDAKDGWKPTKEHNEKNRQAHLGSNNHFYGKKHTPESIEKMKKPRKKWGNHTPESKELMRQKKLVYWANKRMQK